MAKTKKYKDRHFWQSGRGYRLRKIASFAIPSISDSGDVWDVNKNTTTKWPLIIAPCDLKVQRCNVNAVTYPHFSVAGGTCTVTFYKADASGDTALTSALSIVDQTDETALDATLAHKDISEGEMVYASLAVSNHTVGTAAANVIFQIEYRHNEN